MDMKKVLMGVLFLAVAWFIYNHFLRNKGVTFGGATTYGYDAEGDLVETFKHHDDEITIMGDMLFFRTNGPK